MSEENKERSVVNPMKKPFIGEKRICPSCKGIVFATKTMIKFGDYACKKCAYRKGRKYTERERKNRAPWVKTYYYIKYRTDFCKEGMSCYKSYRSKGIKNFLTISELKRLWFRDKAYEMKRPSIDRINSKGHYTFKNCRYLELKKNLSRKWLERTKCDRGHKLTEKNTYRCPNKNSRECVKCRDARRKIYYEKNKK